MSPAASKLDLRRPGFFGAGSVEVTPSKDGEGGIRRNALHTDKLLTQPSEDVVTIPDVLAHAVRKYPNKRAVGWRDVVKIHEEKKVIKKTVNGQEEEETKIWKFFELSDPQYWTFTQFGKAIEDVARGFIWLGITKDDVTNVYAQTGVNWQLIAQACAALSTPIATSYETLGPEGLTHSINEPECRSVFTNADLLPTLLKVLPNTPTVRFVFYDGAPSAKTLQQIQAINNIKTYHVDAVRQLGREHHESDEELAQRKPTVDTIACIMYTSGSTGAPKGVQLSHGNLIASLASVYFLFGHHLPDDSVYLAYLPLAHVFEYIVELVAMYGGVTSVYARPKTLTDQSVRNCKGDLTAYQPTVMLGVPAVWETIRKGIVGKLDKMGWATKTVVETALAMKKRNVPVMGYLMDKYVLKNVREPTGGNLRWAINGGAAISKDTQEYLSLSIMPLMQGYGMTESCGMCAILPPELLQFGSVGVPVPSLEVKLVDCPDMGYTSKNDPPQGEICIRGPSVTHGYFKRPDLNADESIFAKDGWFRTGDIGQWNPDGTLSVIDRLKNLVKLQSGEYIALEKLESIYKSASLTANVCLYASQDATQPVAVIVPNEPNLRSALSSSTDPEFAALVDKPLAELCANDAVRKLVLKECNDTGKKNKFKGAELLQNVVLTAEEWTPENGLVTAAQKVNRNVISKAFKDQIAAAYEQK